MRSLVLSGGTWVNTHGADSHSNPASTSPFLQFVQRLGGFNAELASILLNMATLLG